jgi:hypothetical protein
MNKQERAVPVPMIKVLKSNPKDLCDKIVSNTLAFPWKKAKNPWAYMVRRGNHRNNITIIVKYWPESGKYCLFINSSLFHKDLSQYH